MPAAVGATVSTRSPGPWTTSHGDLHFGNVCGPNLIALDWEGWAPAGYDAAMLHTYSLLVPDVAAAVRHHLAHQMDTPSGRFAELAVITQLLQTNARGDNLDLACPMRHRLHEISGERG
jgi:hypothetical protein